MDAASRIPRISHGGSLRVDALRRPDAGSSHASGHSVVKLPVLAGWDGRERRRAPVFHAAPFVTHLLAGHGSPDGDRRRAAAAGMAARASARYRAQRSASDGIGPGFLAERLV